MKARKSAVAGAVFIAAVAVLGYAQQPGFTRKLLQDHNLSVPERHAVQALAEFVPGGAAGRHTHPGEELGYVVEGTLLLEVDGQPPRTLKAGDAFLRRSRQGARRQEHRQRPGEGARHLYRRERQAGRFACEVSCSALRSSGARTPA